MYTLEIGGIPIAITDAEEADARAIFESAEFRQDLTVLTHDGKPLWDGQAPLTVRAASPGEVAAFESPDQELDDGLEDGEDGAFVTFLIPIDHDHEAVSDVPPELQGGDSGAAP